jgi:transcriptional regulator with XRE-family HTH domain
VATDGERTPRQRLLADHLRRHRDRTGLSQEDLANAAKVNRTYYASLETGRRNPTLEILCRLAIALECDTADLVRGTQAVEGRPTKGEK